MCLQREIAEDDETQQQDLDDAADNIVENNAEDVPIRDEVKEVASLEALPVEIIEKIFIYCFITSSFEFPIMFVGHTTTQ